MRAPKQYGCTRAPTTTSTRGGIGVNRHTGFYPIHPVHLLLGCLWCTVACNGDGSGGASAGSSDTSTSSEVGSDAGGTTTEGGATLDTSTTDPDAEAFCGNGVVDPGEICDDGINDGSYGGCAANCDALAPGCGDAEVQGEHGEACDDGINDGAYGGCLPGCDGLAARCGDGLVDADHAEACDDGDDVDEDACNTDCQVPGSILWEDVRDGLSHGGNDEDRAVSVLDRNGDVVVVAREAIVGPPSNRLGIWARQYTHDGVPVWTKSHDLTDANLTAQDAAIDADGSVTVVGYRDDLVVEFDDWMGFLDDDGEIEFDENVDPDVGAWWRVHVDPRDALILRAYTMGTVVQKRDGTGAIWTVAAGDDTIVDIAVDGAGNVFACGQSALYGGRSLLLKYSPDGALSWSRINLTLEEYRRVAATPDEGAVVTGRTSDYDYNAVSYSDDGEQRWTDTPYETSLAEVAVDIEGRVGLSGYDLDADLPILRKLTADGEEIWQIEVPDVDAIKAADRLVFAADQDLLVAGSATGYGQNGQSNFIGGRAVWVARVAK